MNEVSSFFENTTKVFSGVITHGGSNPDITNDTVTFMMKSDKGFTDASAEVDVDASSLDSSGNFTVILSASDTTVATGLYYYEIVWYVFGGTEHYVLLHGTLTVKNKYQDNL